MPSREVNRLTPYCTRKRVYGHGKAFSWASLLEQGHNVNKHQPLLHAISRHVETGGNCTPIGKAAKRSLQTETCEWTSS